MSEHLDPERDCERKVELFTVLLDPQRFETDEIPSPWEYPDGESLRDILWQFPLKNADLQNTLALLCVPPNVSRPFSDEEIKRRRQVVVDMFNSANPPLFKKIIAEYDHSLKLKREGKFKRVMKGFEITAIGNISNILARTYFITEQIPQRVL